MKVKRLLFILFIFAFMIYLLLAFKYQHLLLAILALANSSKLLIILILSTLLLICGHVIRALNTKSVIDQVKPARLRTHLRALFVGYTFNILLPLRAGEFIRAWILSRSLQISGSFVFSVILFERAIDGLILGSATLLVLRYYGQIFQVGTEPFIPLAIIVIIVSFVLLMTLELLRSQNKYILKSWHWLTELLNQRLRDSARFKLWSVIYGLQTVINQKIITRYIARSILNWSCYFGSTFMLASYYFGHNDLAANTTKSVVAFLGITAPTGPAYFGDFQAVTLPILNTILEVKANQLYLLSVWVMLSIPVFVLGLISLYRTRENFQKLVQANELAHFHNKLARQTDITGELRAFLDSFFSVEKLSHILHEIETNEGVKLIRYFKGGSNAITILVYENGIYRVRKLTPPEHAHRLRAQHDWLKTYDKKSKIVSVAQQKETANYYAIDIEYYSDFLPFIDFIHSHDIDVSKNILTKIYDYMFKEIYKLKPARTDKKTLEAYIANRCINKIEQTAKLHIELDAIIKQSKLIINGKPYLGLYAVLDKIKSNKKAWYDIATFRPSIIHGDLTVDNLLVSEKDLDFKIVDPVDENEIESPVVDFGRSMQSFGYGYEFLCRDDSPVHVNNGNNIYFENNNSLQYGELKKTLQKLAKKYLTVEEQRAILFHTGVMFSRMSAHRVRINPDNLIKFYAVAIIAFNEFLEQYK